MVQRPAHVERSAGGTRAWLNRHSGVATGALVAFALIGVIAIVVQVMASRKRYPTGSPPSYFTVDDGKSYFTAGAENVPPFQHDGQTAVRAYVFRCGTAEPFVGYVERFTPEAHREIVAGRGTPEHQISGRELKRPGETNWVRSNNRKGAGQVSDVRCPDGSQPEPLEPS